ncbi:MAG: glycosyltransferase family 2 protein [bacterium]|nr:glycosyltransferase family 2 protein [bacterium]
MTPTISVIIINRNTQPLLATCLEAVQKTIPPLVFETIVVDNGSTDENIAFLQSLKPQIKLIRNEKNLGFAKAVNQAIEVASRKYLLILNTDIILTENAVAYFVEFMENTPDAGMVGGQLLNSDGSNQNSIAPFPSLVTELMNKSLLRRFNPKKYYHKNVVYKNPITVDSLVGAAFLVQKEAIDIVGKMDERFFFYFEETDWCKRFVKNGYKIYFIPTVRIYHKQGQSLTASLKIRGRIEYAISRYRYFKKHFSPGMQSILRIGLMVKLIIELISNILIGLFSFYLMQSVRNRFKTAFILFFWHLRGCPPDWGLSNKY